MIRIFVTGDNHIGLKYASHPAAATLAAARLAAFEGMVASEDDSPAVAAETFVEAIRAMNAAMGIPETLSAIRKEDIDALSTHAAREANPLYPVPKLMTKRELASLYHHIT